MPPEHQPITGVVLSRDLFFPSKVTGTASALGARVVMEGDPGSAAKKAAEPGCRCLIVDLAVPGLSLESLLSGLPREHRPRVIAYDAHVNEARIEAARAAGCDAVYTRGQFSAGLAAILRDCFSDSDAPA